MCLPAGVALQQLSICSGPLQQQSLYQPVATGCTSIGQRRENSSNSKQRVQTYHSLLEPEGAAHFLPVLPHDDMLQALKQGRGDGVIPQPVELVPGSGVRCPQTQAISKLHLVEGVCQQLLALHAAVMGHSKHE